MTKVAGVKKPNENQEATALWRMKAASDSGEERYDPEQRDNILGRNKRDWNCGKSTSKTQLWHWAKLRSAWRIRMAADNWLETFCGLGLQWLVRHGAKDVLETFVGKCLARFGSLGQCPFAHSLHALECRVSSTFSL